MTAQQPQQEPEMIFPHCIHGVFDESELRTHCLKDSGTCLDWKKCEGRVPRPHTPAPEPVVPIEETLDHLYDQYEELDGLQEFPFSFTSRNCKGCRKCSCCEPTCHETCGIYQSERAAAIARAATLAENKRVLDEVKKQMENGLWSSGGQEERIRMREIIRSLRQNAGEQR